MIKVEAKDGYITDFVVSGDIKLIASELGAIIKTIHQITNDDNPLAAQAFKKLIQTTTRDDSPVWNANVRLEVVDKPTSGGGN